MGYRYRLAVFDDHVCEGGFFVEPYSAGKSFSKIVGFGDAG